MDKDIRKFISAKRDLIVKDQWDDFYKIALNNLSTSDVGQLTETLLKADIHPLDYLNYVPDHFLYGSSIQQLSIPRDIKHIGYGAFAHCCGLTSITIPDSVTQIGSNAFSCCSGLTSIAIGSGVTRIGSEAFESCTKLTSITIPNSVTSIGTAVFGNCTGLTSIIFTGRVSRWESINKGVGWSWSISSDCVIHCTDGDLRIKRGK